MKRDIYVNYLKTNKEELNKINKISSNYTYLRIIIFLMFLLLIYNMIANITVLNSIIFLIIVATFTVVVVKHGMVKNKHEYLKCRHKVIERYIARFDGEWGVFEETGSNLNVKLSYLAADLNIVGNNSLFQYVNIGKTTRGKQKLVDSLLFGEKDFNKRQHAISTLATNVEFSIKIQTLLENTNKNDDNTIIDNFTTVMKKMKNISPIINCIRIVLTTLIILSIFNIFGRFSLSVLLLSSVFQLIIGILSGISHNELFNNISKVVVSLRSYQKIFEHINCVDDSILNEMIASDANIGLKKLSKIADLVEQRQNVLLLVLCNAVVMYDVICINKIIKWTNLYLSDVDEWFSKLALLESLLSLAVIQQVNENVCIPIISDDNELQFDDITHPLIAMSAVPNNFLLEENINVITGSNMSGKTTFLRTLGINMLLAYSGSAVCAKKAVLDRFTLLTSLNVLDDLNSGTSTFYAELSRIKIMIDNTKNNDKVCCLIDEIFKGTNSLDRIAGAKEAIVRLHNQNAVVFVSTHDFELCELGNQIPIKNYHFKEYYKDDKIFFDYKINKGQSTTTNAQYLLKMVGILD